MSDSNVDQETSYPDPLPQYESDYVRRKRMTERVKKKVLAPQEIVMKRIQHSSEVGKKYLSYYAQKKPSNLMQDMARFLLDCSDIRVVLNETALILREATYSAAVTVYMMDDALDEIYQATEDIDDEHRISYQIKTGTNVAAHVASTKEFVKIDDLLEDIRFPEGLGNAVEVTVKSVLGVPVMTPEDECLAVFILHRKMDEPIYDDQHLRLVIVICGWIGSTIYQNQQRVTLQKQQELNEYLLNLTKCYFADAMMLDKLITEVIVKIYLFHELEKELKTKLKNGVRLIYFINLPNFAKIALNAEHGLFFVMKPKNDELYADYYEEGIGNDQETLFKKNMKIKLNNETDLVSIVAQKGVAINIRNAYNDTRVDQDKRKGYITRSVLCIPIKGVDEILGVIQIVNKQKASWFTKSDEILFHTFSVYCGFVLSYARLYEKMCKANNLNSVYSEMLTLHMQPCIHDYYFVYNHPDVSALPHRFNQFDFYISDTFEHYMPQLVMYMFNEISKELFENVSVLTKFVLIVQKSYHNHPYHNFHHAFNVCHCVYNMVRRNMELFTLTEMRALVIAAYCHDVDHYGVTNNFLEITTHYLSQLYEESVLENHHFHVASFIIKFLNLFNYMGHEEYKDFLSEVKACILATDLASYFKKRGKLYLICAENKFEWEDETHRSLLKSIMMTMGDLSGLCKPYNTAKELIDNIYKEFYNEGDKEKEMGLCPLSIMDREKINMIPADQVQFMTVVVLPCALILSKLLPNCGALYKEALKLREVWQEINDFQGQKLWTLEDSLPADKKPY